MDPSLLNRGTKGGAQVVVSTDRHKGIFQKAQQEYAKDGKIVVPGYLRIEQKIVNGKTKYDFAITRDSNSDSPTELKLDRNDLFKVTDVGLFLMRRDSTLIGHEVLQTYANYIAFPPVGSPFTFNPTHLESFYNGKLSLVVGQTKWIEGLDTRRFRYVGAQQESLTTDGNTPPTIINFIQQSSGDEKSGFIEMTPQITLDGNQKNQLSIEAPIASGHIVANTAANTNNYLVVVFRGLLITNRK